MISHVLLAVLICISVWESSCFQELPHNINLSVLKTCTIACFHKALHIIIDYSSTSCVSSSLRMIFSASSIRFFSSHNIHTHGRCWDSSSLKRERRRRHSRRFSKLFGITKRTFHAIITWDFSTNFCRLHPVALWSTNWHAHTVRTTHISVWRWAKRIDRWESCSRLASAIWLRRVWGIKRGLAVTDLETCLRRVTRNGASTSIDAIWSRRSSGYVGERPIVVR